MKRSATLLLLLTAGLLAGCGRLQEAPEAMPSGSSPASEAVDLSLPTAYAGLIPCADCPGIRLTVKLRPDSLYLLRMTYLEAEDGRDLSFYALGAWRRVDSTLHLYSGDERPRLFRLNTDSIEMLDREGHAIESGLNYTLARVDTAVALKGPFSMTGHFSYMADAALFALCGSEQPFPVAMEGAYLELERAYLEVREESNEKIVARLRGHLSMLPGMEAGTEEEMIVVDEFLGLAPGSPCPPADTSL